MTRTPAAITLVAALVWSAPAAAQDALPGGAERFEDALIDTAERSRGRTVLVFGVIGLGSGAVVSTDGVVVTNAHVVAASRYAVVQWADGSTTFMHRRGIDYGRDLAVLEPEEPLERPAPAFSLGETSAVGDWVVALGYPGGLRADDDATASLGTVTGLGGEGGADGPVGALDYSSAIRTDVPIFSGNSGGPLVALDGRLAGINGAVRIEQATSLTIPVEAVRARLETLTDEVVVLPSGRRIEPRETPLLGGLYDLLDPLARQLPRRVAEGSRAVQDAESPALPDLPEDWEPPAGGAALAEKAREKPRQEALDRVLSGSGAQVGREAGLVLEGGIRATRVAPGRVVCKASRLGDRETVAIPDRPRARRVAVSREDDLALLAHRVTRAVRPPPPAPHRPVGSLAYVVGPDGIRASGMVSVAPRPTRATLLAQIQQAGVPEVVQQALDSLRALSERAGLGPLEELLDQIERSIEMRRAFAAGTRPRSYPEVLSIDAPLAPDDVGAPIVDRSGQLVGVSVGIAHHGTTYVVPLHRVRRVFAAHLEAAPVPERRGEAQLY